MLWNKDNLFYPTRPGSWQQFLRNLLLFVAQWFYKHQPPVQVPPLDVPAAPIRVVCLSDTQNETPRVPEGDILIYVGDLTQNGTFAELQAQLSWLASLPHEHKIVVAGNHDLLLDSNFFVKHGPSQGVDPSIGWSKDDLVWGDIIYLDSQCTTLHIRSQTIKLFGSPMTPKYGNWAFQYSPTQDVWANKIPTRIDIVITHGPAKGHLDNDTSKLSTSYS